MGLPATRCAIRVRGTVQGVGFRPTVYRLASAAHRDLVDSHGTGNLEQSGTLPKCATGRTEWSGEVSAQLYIRILVVNIVIGQYAIDCECGGLGVLQAAGD